MFLAREGAKLSKTMVHKYMNKDLELYCITAKNHLKCLAGPKSEVFPNYLSQNFNVKDNNIICVLTPHT